MTQSGDPYYGQWFGPYDVNSMTTMVSITDGTSNTIGFGETLWGTDQGTRDWAGSWMGCGAQVLAWDLIEPCVWNSFGSKHTTLVQFAFCDGSVRGLPKIGPSTPWFSTQWFNLQYAGGIQDGSIIDWSQLGN